MDTNNQTAVFSFLEHCYYSYRVASINLISSFHFKKSLYKRFYNVNLSNGNDTHYIDLVIVSIHGIFVVDVVKAKGKILGSLKQPMWVQVKRKREQAFPSPILNNISKLNDLSKMLNVDKGKFFSVTIFAGKSKFDNPLPENVSSEFGFVDFIKSKREALLRPHAVKHICEKINNNRLELSLASQKS